MHFLKQLLHISTISKGWGLTNQRKNCPWSGIMPQTNVLYRFGKISEILNEFYFIMPLSLSLFKFCKISPLTVCIFYYESFFYFEQLSWNIDENHLHLIFIRIIMYNSSFVNTAWVKQILQRVCIIDHCS